MMKDAETRKVLVRPLHVDAQFGTGVESQQLVKDFVFAMKSPNRL